MNACEQTKQWSDSFFVYNNVYELLQHFIFVHFKGESCMKGQSNALWMWCERLKWTTHCNVIILSKEEISQTLISIFLRYFLLFCTSAVLPFTFSYRTMAWIGLITSDVFYSVRTLQLHTRSNFKTDAVVHFARINLKLSNGESSKCLFNCFEIVYLFYGINDWPICWFLTKYGLIVYPIWQ